MTPHANAPPTRNEESCPPPPPRRQWPPLPETKNLGPPKGSLLKNAMFWLILELQSVASWTHKIILVMKGKYIMDGSACGLCLNNIAYCMLPMQELPGPGEFQTLELTCLFPMQELPRDIDN